MTHPRPSRRRTPAPHPDRQHHPVAPRLHGHGHWHLGLPTLARFGLAIAVVIGLVGVTLPLTGAGVAAATTSSTALVPSYRMVAADGGIFDFGGTAFDGSMGGHPLNEPMVGMASTPTGQGYWTVAADGGVFCFGDAQFYGSTGSIHLNKPVVGMAATPDGKGYWLVAADGGIFTFGDAAFYGSTGGLPLPGPVVGMAATPTGKGYWIVTSTGFVSNFGDAIYYGSAPAHLVEPVVGIAASLGTGQLGPDPPYTSGSVGYDVSKYQCTSLPPGPYRIMVVQTNGWGDGAANPCLSQEAAWAGAALNLYTFLTCNAAPSSTGATPPGSQPCSYDQGVSEATYAYDTAKQAGVDVSVSWWLDVEPGYWSPNTTDNQNLVAGALAGLRALGVPDVGIYASPGAWSQMVGSYSPEVPYWAAYWHQTAPSTTCATLNGNPKYPVLPGPVVMVQYSSPSKPDPFPNVDYTTFDNDYAC